MLVLEKFHVGSSICYDSFLAGGEIEGEKMRKKHWSDHIFKDLQKSVNLFGKR